MSDIQQMDILAPPPPVGAAEGCDLLILIFGDALFAKEQDQKIAAFGSSYGSEMR